MVTPVFICILLCFSIEQSQHRVSSSTQTQHPVPLGFLHSPTEQWRRIRWRGSIYPYQHGTTSVRPFQLSLPVPWQPNAPAADTHRVSGLELGLSWVPQRCPAGHWALFLGLPWLVSTLWRRKPLPKHSLSTPTSTYLQPLYSYVPWALLITAGRKY